VVITAVVTRWWASRVVGITVWSCGVMVAHISVAAAIVVGYIGGRAHFGGGDPRRPHMRPAGMRNALNARALSHTLATRPRCATPNSAPVAPVRRWQAGITAGRKRLVAHGNGGYGWVGPLFGRSLILTSMTIRSGQRFWGPVLGTATTTSTRMFAPYAYDDLARYLPPRVAAPAHPMRDRCWRNCAVTTAPILGLRLI